MRAKIKLVPEIIGWACMSFIACCFAFAMVTIDIIVKQNKERSLGQNKLIYLHNSGMHLELIFPKD